SIAAGVPVGDPDLVPRTGHRLSWPVRRGDGTRVISGWTGDTKRSPVLLTFFQSRDGLGKFAGRMDGDGLPTDVRDRVVDDVRESGGLGSQRNDAQIEEAGRGPRTCV